MRTERTPGVVAVTNPRERTNEIAGLLMTPQINLIRKEVKFHA